MLAVRGWSSDFGPAAHGPGPRGLAHPPVGWALGRVPGRRAPRAAAECRL